MFPQGLEDTPFSKGVNTGKYSKWELCILWGWRKLFLFYFILKNSE